MSGTYLYGMEHSSHDFTSDEAFGKNIFTNAFPVALVNYMADAKGLSFDVITATIDEDGEVGTEHVKRPIEEIIGIPIDRAFWAFEDSFEGYDAYATTTANRSDLVVIDRVTKKECSAFEVKLVAVPTSGTANRPRGNQSCELVVRPPSIEQACFSIAASYGKDRRYELGDIITEQLGNPADYDWSNQSYMCKRLQKILNAAESVITHGIESQTPFALNAIWRTIGQDSKLDPECFDVLF